jgi:hypothetical protein
VTRRSTSLADRLAKMASTSEDDETTDGAEDTAPAAVAERPLKVAPAPADAEDDVLDKAPTEPEAADPTDDAADEQPGDQGADQPEAIEPVGDSTGEGRGAVQTAQVLASEAALTAPRAAGEPEEGPEPVEPEPVAEKPAPRRRKTSATTTSGTSSTEATPSTLGLHNLAATMERGRNQRRWVEDNLPHRSERGTFMRLPVHLLDVLDEYCDRRDLPQQDFVAAVLDSYFRDLGALPPLGAGHHPDEQFFAEMRRQQRSRDY